MRLASFITIFKPQRHRGTYRNQDKKCLLYVCFLTLWLCFSVVEIVAQRVAVILPDGTEQSKEFSARLGERLKDKVNLLDGDLSFAAYRSISPQAPFNLTATESRLIGATIGCDFFILVRSATQRRSAFRRDEYYEAYAHVFVVSSRTGRLVFWKNHKLETPKAESATKQLYDSVDSLANELTAAIALAQKSEANESPAPSIEEVPDADSPIAKDFKAPIPYLRIKPEYTTEAALYSTTATIEILVDTDVKGAITRTEIVRWAGFGLEESVEKAVRAMNWRPAFRGGKPLPMRFLLRYNFKKIEKEE